MTAPTLPPFDLLARECHDDPYPVYRRYREADPVHWIPGADAGATGTVFLFRHADVMGALRHPNLIRNARVLPAGPLRGLLEQWMLFRNPPDHTRLRSLVSRAFTPQRADQLVPAIRAIAQHLLDAVQDQGGMDLIRDFASPLPLMVIAELLGVPSADREQLRKWTIDLVLAIDIAPNREELHQATVAAHALMTYLRDRVAERRAGRREDDLISALIEAEEAGDRLSEDELLAMCSLLLGAGHETTVNLIGNGSLALLQHRDEWEQLVHAGACSEAAVEELLRYDSPVQITFREAAQDGELLGRPIRRGEMVVILLGSANRDPVVFPDPDRLDLARPIGKHAAFGMGIHYCLGPHLARLEGRIAFETLATRVPGMRPVPGPVQRRGGIAFRGLRTLPVTF